MSEQRFSTLAVGQPYPVTLPAGEGAFADFLRPAGNRLLIVISNISKPEAKALRKGEMRCGLLANNGALLFIWQFMEKGKPVFTLDSPFDAHVIPDIQLHDVDNNETRLSIDVHIVDAASSLVKGLRIITLPPGLTIEFLSSVQDQLAGSSSGEQQQQHWMAYPPHELARKTQMWLLGK